MKGSVQLVQKVATGSVDDAGNTVNPMLSQGPIARIDGITNGREDGGVVAGP